MKLFLDFDDKEMETYGILGSASNRREEECSRAGGFSNWNINAHQIM